MNFFMNNNNNFNMNFFNMNNNMNNQFNFQQNNIKCPYKPIITNTNIKDINESTFINSVLQSLASFSCIYNWIKSKNQQVLTMTQNLKITKELYNLFYFLYSGQFADSSNFILNFFNAFKYKYQNINLKQDPYHFLFYLFDIIHSEDNSPLNPNYDATILNSQSLVTQRNKFSMRNLFTKFLEQSQNSIISNNFYNIFGQEIKCNNCPSLFYDSFKYIIKFKLDDYKKYRDEAYPNKKNENLNLDECFECFTGGNNSQCNNCGNLQRKTFISFVRSAKILVIALIRMNHIYKCDLDFKNKYNINAFLEYGIANYKNYFLKACISLNNQGKYFSDIFINGFWFRFYENNLSMLNNVNVEIHQYEPQLLFYELEN